MSITYSQAIAQLATLTENGRIPTQQELRTLASSVSVYADGSVTVLYGGKVNGADSGGIVRARSW